MDGADHVFVPKYANSHDHSLNLLQRQFEVLIAMSGLPRVVSSEIRSLYSFRHSSIMYRLLYGAGIKTLVLARNARTRVEMIERCYAKPLSVEMNIDMLQSKHRQQGDRGEGVLLKGHLVIKRIVPEYLNQNFRTTRKTRK